MPTPEEIERMQAEINHDVAAGTLAVKELKDQGLSDEEISHLAMVFSPVPVKDLPKSCGGD